MKNILALTVAALGLGLATPSEAQAWDFDHDGYSQCDHDSYAPRIVSYTRCGRPIYSRYEVYGYDRCGNPVGRWVTQRTRCSCGVCRPRPRSQCGHNSRFPVPPPPPGLNWFFSIGR